MICPLNFYGANLNKQKLEELKKKAKNKPRYVVPYKAKNISDPVSTTWLIFKKQDQAINCSRSLKSGLMNFAYQTVGLNGRLFLVAHPQVFWHYDIQKIQGSRCTYEIIPEHSVCKFYLDLEYNKILNIDKDGNAMVESLIDIISFYFKKLFNINSNRNDILDLDSTTKDKFSRHLIYNFQYCFLNNRHAGEFINFIYQNLLTAFENNEPLEILSKEQVKNLFVNDNKGTSIFCDLGVYTKNRHFRLYGSTKLGKNSPLILSKNNQYQASSDLDIFLNSLITRVDKDVKVLECEPKISKSCPSVRNSNGKVEVEPSPYPFIDKFINDLVHPGKIYRSIFFSTSNCLVYDIVGNRYCENIKREHKSNNIKYIVDLLTSTYYQKCHDWECKLFKSKSLALPENLKFLLSDDSDFINLDSQLGCFEITEENGEKKRKLSVDEDNKTFKRFPSFGLSDSDFNTIDI